MKKIGIVPARMRASRFPNKPLHPILGKPMLEHVFRRSKLYQGWDELVVATCDKEIEDYCKENAIPMIMTGSHHTRALDRVAEATAKLSISVSDTDVIVCVQGDEPMLRPDMIDSVIKPLNSPKIPCAVLAMHITEKEIWLNQDTVKIIHNEKGEVLYTSRVPIPHAKQGFSADLMARRIYGIFAFRWKYLQLFTKHEETRLEQVEACDSNRILDMSFTQHIAPYPYVKSYSVDSPKDIELVESHMVNDPYIDQY